MNDERQQTGETSNTHSKGLDDFALGAAAPEAEPATSPDPSQQPAAAPKKRSGLPWEPEPWEGGSRVWALGFGYLSSKVKYRRQPSKQLRYLKNYIDTAAPILEFMGFDDVAGFASLEADWSPEKKFKAGLVVLAISTVLASDSNKGPNLTEILQVLGSGGDLSQLIAEKEALPDDEEATDAGQQPEKRPKPAPALPSAPAAAPASAQEPAESAGDEQAGQVDEGRLIEALTGGGAA